MGVEQDSLWMSRALELAHHAETEGEVPVGAIVVREGKVIGEGWNSPISLHDPSAHAEIRALRAAANSVQNYRLPGSTLYVTLEPCPMCAGAIIHARVERVVFAAADPRSGAAGSLFQLLNDTALNHQCTVDSGIMATESSDLLKKFFRKRRNRF